MVLLIVIQALALLVVAIVIILGRAVSVALAGNSVLGVATAGEGVVQLATARPAALLAREARRAASEALGLLVVEQLEVVLVSRVVPQPAAAGQDQAATQAAAEGHDEPLGAVDPDLRLGRHIGQEGREPRGAAGLGCRRARSCSLVSRVSSGLGRAVWVVGRVGRRLASMRRGDTGPERRGGGRKRRGRHLVVVGVVLLGGHGQDLSLRGIVTFTPQLKMPIRECAVVVVDDGGFDNDSPLANS